MFKAVRSSVVVQALHQHKHHMPRPNERQDDSGANQRRNCERWDMLQLTDDFHNDEWLLNLCYWNAMCAIFTDKILTRVTA